MTLNHQMLLARQMQGALSFSPRRIHHNSRARKGVALTRGGGEGEGYEGGGHDATGEEQLFRNRPAHAVGRVLGWAMAEDMREYRLLIDGDQIQRGDEFLEEDAVTWTPIDWHWHTCIYSKNLFQPMRRRI